MREGSKVIDLRGRQYVTWEGVLDKAHSVGLKSIDTELLQIPNTINDNTAIVKAKVEMEDGRTFTGIGDASPQNVSKNIIPHIIRMAETRAKRRALGDATNIGAIGVEDLHDEPRGASRTAEHNQLLDEIEAELGDLPKGVEIDGDLAFSYAATSPAHARRSLIDIRERARRANEK